jgi:hypothetical protein
MPGSLTPERFAKTMRFSPHPYLCWVLIPVAIFGVLGQKLAARRTEAQSQTTTARMGGLATRLFAEEMGRYAAEMVGEAPILTNPDPNSPLVRAARRGDTVAALGTSSGTLTLSVALAEGAADSLTIRSTTVPFPVMAPTLVSSRAGYAVALYLRGRRALTTTEAFGPEEIAESSLPPYPAPTPLPEGSALLPLTPSAGRIASPAQLLVGRLHPREAEDPRWSILLGILVALGLGIAAGFTPSTRSEEGTRPTVRLLTLTGIPLAILWISLLSTGIRVGAEAENSLREDMVRVLAILRDADDPLTPVALMEATDFHMLRREGDRVVETNIPDGGLRESLLALPLPPPTFPSLGTIKSEGSDIVYAHLRVGPESALTLTAASTTQRQRGFTLLLSGFGGIASLLSLGFLGRSRRKG